jgi:Ca2+-binding RTX toxin-like protein
MASFVVTTLADAVNAGDGVVSLREALTLAQGNAGADTITFAANLAGGSTPGLNDGRLVLTNGPLTVDSDVTINGDVVSNDGVPDITLDGNQLSTVLDITAGTSGLHALVVTGAYFFSAVRIASGAGATITRSSITGNGDGEVSGAGVYNQGTAVLTDTTVSGNQGGVGGGIYNRGILALTNVTLANNSAFLSGGGSYGRGYGGGLFNDDGATATLVNVTVYGNAAGRGGGGILNLGTATLTNTTVTGNYVGKFDSGGMANYGTATLTNSLIAGNYRRPDDPQESDFNDSSGVTTFAGLNIIGVGSDTDASDHVINTATLADVFAALATITMPRSGNTFSAGQLANNGGPLPTVAILQGGPANNPTGSVVPTDTTDADGDLNTSEPLPVDARGLVRLSGGSVDVGAFEIQDAVIVPPLPPPSSGPSSGRDEIFGDEGANTIAALAGGDVVWGLGGGDLLLGNDGADTVHAGLGNNTVFGGKDNDLIDAGDGNDLLFGNEGFDSIDGGDGNNTIVGGNDSADGADTITAGAGADLIWGNGGNDSIVADGGANTIVGGFGDDRIASGDAADILFGNQGNDCIVAGDGADLVFGGQGDDAIVAGPGNDTVFGNEGNDTIAGGAGADRLVFATGSGADQVDGFSFAEGDRLDLQGQTFTLGTSADGDVVLVLSGGGTVELNGVPPAGFSPGSVV